MEEPEQAALVGKSLARHPHWQKDTTDLDYFLWQTQALTQAAHNSS